MPTFQPEDMDISPDEFVSSCDKYELDELLNLLEEDFAERKRKSYRSPHQVCAAEGEYRDAVTKLLNSWNRLSQEEEETIKRIAQRF